LTSNGAPATTDLMAELEPFVRVLHPDALKSLTDSPSFERGERYFREGRVGELSRQAGAIKAIVSGTTPYEVRIWVRGDQLAYSCTCPSAEQGFFCKHCVAVAFAWLKSEPEGEKASPSMHESHAGLIKAPIDVEPKRDARPQKDSARALEAPARPKSDPVKARPVEPQLRLDVAASKSARWEPGRVHAHLRKQDPATLADLLLDFAEHDPAIKDALMRLLPR
jgi:uncharacterized Zn finger protein